MSYSKTLMCMTNNHEPRGPQAIRPEVTRPFDAAAPLLGATALGANASAHPLAPVPGGPSNKTARGLLDEGCVRVAFIT